MFPPLRPEFAPNAVSVPQKNPVSARDMPNVRDGNFSNACWNPFGGRRRKQQFIIFPAMQRKLQVNLPRGLAYAGPWAGFLLLLFAHATLFADMS